MSTTRWDRLAADLAAAGISARVDAQPWTEMAYGRPRSGVSRSIMLRRPDGGTVEVRDAWWRKNPDIWIGWEVSRADAAGIERRRPVRTKKRSEAVAAIAAGLAAEGGEPR